MANNITLSYPSAFHHQFLDQNGKPLTGGKLYTYSAGTSTSIPTYKTIGDTSSTNTNTNPIILDNAGVAHIVIEKDKAYKFVLFDKNDAKIDEWDNVTGNIGGGGGGSEDIVVVGTPNEIDVSGSVIQGVKRYVVSLSNSVKSTILYLVGLYNNVLNSLGNKADKVQGATAGNLAALDASGNLTDSGSKVADFKTKQTAVSDPSASGAGLEFIDSVTQDANGEITPHKKSVQDGTTAQKGVVKLSNAIDSTSVTEAATPKAVKDAYDELNNKIVARAVFLSQAEWAVQSQLQGDPAKVYYVENGTGEDAYTVYVWKESTSTYEEVDESSIDLDGYWHDEPTTTGSGNVVTNITLGNNGVPQIEKGITALTQHQSVTDNDPTLAWGTRSKVGTIGGTELHVTMPSNPASGKLDSTGDASNTTATFTKASGDTSTMASGSKLSAIFTAISSFFASLKALAFKDKASYNDLSRGVQSSLDKADTALQSHQDISGKLNISGSVVGGFLTRDSWTDSNWNEYGTAGYTKLWINNTNIPYPMYKDQLFYIMGQATDTKKVYAILLKSNYDINSGNLNGTTIGLMEIANVPSVINNLTSDSTTDALSAALGKALNNDKLDKTGDASNTTSTFTKASGDTSSMASGSKLSAIFTAISSFFASVLSALGGKADKASITGATKCKITYNGQGIVTSGADLGASDIPNLPSSKITSGTFGTDRIADDAITAAKVKDNETLPVNVSGNAGSSYSLIGKNMVSGSNGYSLLATLELTNVNAVYAGAMLAVVCRGGVACFEGIVSVSLSEYTNAGNETAPIVGNVVVMNCRGANLEALTSKFDFYMLRIEAGKYQLYVHKKGSGLPVSCTLLAATECTCTLYSSGAIANLPSAIETKKLDWICNKGVGSPSTPVYVDPDGQVKPCDVLSGGTTNFDRTFTTSYTVGSTDQYITMPIKNDNIDLIADYVTWHNAHFGKLSSPPMIIISVSARDTNVANAGLITLNMYKTGNGCDVFGEKYAYMGNQHASKAYNTQYFTDQTFVSGSTYYLNIRNETSNTMWTAGTILDISIRIVAHAVSVT